MKANLHILTVLILTVLPVSRAYSQEVVKLTDYRIASVQEPDTATNPSVQEPDTGTNRSYKLFDPFAPENRDLLKSEGEIEPLRDEDLGLDEEPDLGDDAVDDDVDEDQSSEKAPAAPEKRDSKNESLPQERLPTIQSKLTIDEYLQPIWTLSSNGQTDLEPERGGLNFPTVAHPGFLTETPRHYWQDSNVQWQKPMGFHRQLYFEDAALERCGTQVCDCDYNQNVASGVRFLRDAALVPIRKFNQPCRQLYQRRVDRFNDPNLTGR